MDRQQRIKVGTVGVAAAVLLLSGCGSVGAAIAPSSASGGGASSHVSRSAAPTSPVSSPGAPSTGGPSSAPAIRFPALIAAALKSLHARTTVPLFAPAVYPASVRSLSNLPLTVTTTVSPQTPPGYALTFLQGPRWLAQFAVFRYASDEMAALHVFGSASTAPAIPSSFAPPNAASTSLGYGLAGRVVLMAAGPGRALVWRTGHWNWAVEYADGQRAAAITIARRLVTFAHDHALPATAIEGVVVVVVTGPTATVMLGWQQEGLAFYAGSAGVWDSASGSGVLNALQLATHVVPDRST